MQCTLLTVACTRKKRCAAAVPRRPAPYWQVNLLEGGRGSKLFDKIIEFLQTKLQTAHRKAVFGLRARATAPVAGYIAGQPFSDRQWPYIHGINKLYVTVPLKAPASRGVQLSCGRFNFFNSRAGLLAAPNCSSQCGRPHRSQIYLVEGLK